MKLSEKIFIGCIIILLFFSIMFTYRLLFGHMNQVQEQAIAERQFEDDYIELFADETWEEYYGIMESWYTSKNDGHVKVLHYRYLVENVWYDKYYAIDTLNKVILYEL